MAKTGNKHCNIHTTADTEGVWCDMSRAYGVQGVNVYECTPDRGTIHVEYVWLQGFKVCATGEMFQDVTEAIRKAAVDFKMPDLLND